MITRLYLLMLLIPFALLAACHGKEAAAVEAEVVTTTDGLAFSEILGRPTNTTVSANILWRLHICSKS